MNHPRLRRPLLALTVAAAAALPGALPAVAAPPAGRPFKSLKVGSSSHKAGFSPVQTLTGTPLAVAVTNESTAEVAARGADGDVVVQTVPDRSARSVTVPVKATDDLVLVAGDGGSLWLVSDGQLWRRQTPAAGELWLREAVPDGVHPTAVVDLPGPQFSVAGYTTRDAGQWQAHVAEVWRWDGRSWTSVGGPDLPDAWREPGSKRITGLRVIDGQLFATVTYAPPRPGLVGQLYRVQGTTWTPVARTYEQLMDTKKTMNVWLNWPGGRQEFLGIENTASPSRGGYCWAYGAPTCTTGGAPGAGVNVGAVAVLGGTDLTPYNSTQVTQATFWQRTAGGAETTIPGDPGDATVAMAAGNRRVFAVTRTGSTYTLQEYRH